MRHFRGKLSLLLVAGVFLVGCSIGGKDPAASPSVVADHLARLRASIAFIDTTSFRSDLDLFGQMGTRALMDSPNKRGSAEVDFPGGHKAEMRLLDDDWYFKAAPELGLPGPKGKWLKLDPLKTPAAFTISFRAGQNDPGGMTRLFGAVNTVEPTSSGFKGTMDLTKVGVGNGVSFKPEQAAGMGEQAKRIPYVVEIDSQGRLTSFVISVADRTVSIRYSDFGLPVTVSRPASAETVPAPAELYSRLGV